MGQEKESYKGKSRLWARKKNPIRANHAYGPGKNPTRANHAYGPGKTPIRANQGYEPEENPFEEVGIMLF